MSSGYQILKLDDLGRYPSPLHDGTVLLPLRRTLGFTAFGGNCWTADAGGQIVPRHEEDSGNEELYVVVRGRARFVVADEERDAPAGTLVYVPAEVTRQAFAEEDGTLVLAIGGNVGKPFTVWDWEAVVVAFSAAEQGRIDEARDVVRQGIEQRPDFWGHPYNLACLEARYGDPDEAYSYLARALALSENDVRELAATDTDLDSLRDDPRFEELFG